MRILHISAECYPAAKAGGLGDVVGALPKYLNRSGIPASVVIPKYYTKWMLSKPFLTVYRGSIRIHHGYAPFSVQQYQGDDLGYPFYVVDIPGKFDRPGIYADPGGGWYRDETERFLCFQQAVLQWVTSLPDRPQVLHCHDHHTGLIPFLVKYGLEFKGLSSIPTVFTIHNGEYHGAFGWDRLALMPFFDAEARGLLDWGDRINPLACAIRCAWHIATVSPSYLRELMTFSNGLEGLIRSEAAKATGILNGIDAQVWDPYTDPYLAARLDGSVSEYKQFNKQVLAHRFNVDLQLPLVTFIGRLVREKGADLLPDLIAQVLNSGLQVAFLILGTGEPGIHDAFQRMLYFFQGRLDIALEYNEGLAHQLYAGSDFLLMPSRVEPCGLNQMYAMRYGTVPVVRSVGGLNDTVPDIGMPGGKGRGIRFDHFNLDDAHHAIWRAYEVFQNQPGLNILRDRIMSVDFSWENAAKNYLKIYNQLT